MVSPLFYFANDRFNAFVHEGFLGNFHGVIDTYVTKEGFWLKYEEVWNGELGTQ